MRAPKRSHNATKEYFGHGFQETQNAAKPTIYGTCGDSKEIAEAGLEPAPPLWGRDFKSKQNSLVHASCTVQQIASSPTFYGTSGVLILERQRFATHSKRGETSV
jgi:hypothetical protein